MENIRMPQTALRRPPPSIENFPGLDYRRGLANHGNDRVAFVLALAEFADSPPRTQDALRDRLNKLGATMLARNPTPDAVSRFNESLRRVLVL
ncbi:hypothetical protein FACS18949_05720 [Clostridia bacterium]|nr:hypothetical protein FACS18949_05720 [Clostridia bacterium]